MDSLDKARQTQLQNIEKRTGQNLDQLRAQIIQSGLTKHADLRSMLMERFGLGFGDASMLVHFALNSDGQSAAQVSGVSMDDFVSQLYAGKTSALLHIHEQIIAEIQKLGEFTMTPKKGYLSLRARRQFIMIGPGSKGRLELGLTLKNLEGGDRLIAQKNNLMCTHKVFLSTLEEVDDELIQWCTLAYQAAK